LPLELQRLINMFKVILAFAVLTAVFTHEANYYKEFQKFTHEFGKSYNSIEEYTQAFESFKENLSVHLLHASQHELSYESGVTKFWDMSFEQFQKTYLNLHIPSLEKFLQSATPYEFKGKVNADPSHDWRDKGSVGPVKDQAACGSCWAFSIVGNLEGVYHIKHKEFKAFSEQQIVDCDKKDQACNGGWMEWGMQYIQQQGGIELQSDYKYTGRLGACQFNKDKIAAVVTGNHFSGTQDEEKIKDMVFQTGPLSVAINANPLFSYKTGIVDLSAAQCNPKGLNHGVTMVGYGTENGKDYWILKNSWNQNWGETGYFRYARGKGTCGVNTYVITAVVQ